MKQNNHIFALAALAALSTMGISACNRHADPSPPVAATDSTTDNRTTADNSANSVPGVTRDSSGMASNGVTAAPDVNTARNSANSYGGTAATPEAALANNPPAAGLPSGTNTTPGTASSATLTSMERKFLADAAAGGMFEVAVAKLAVDKASDSLVKSYASMLAGDHSGANDKLQQLASSKSVALPKGIALDKQKEIDQLSRLSGAEFDKQFVKAVGIRDHQATIDLFEKASRDAKDADVRNYAQANLPTLRAHLTAAQQLPAAR